MPFGFDAVFWRLMGEGIDWMIWVVLWVTGLPRAVGRIQAFGTGPLLVATAGLLLICLLRTPLRWSGVLLVVAASFWAVATPRPDILMAGDGEAAAFRGSDGRLVVIHNGRDNFALKEWLAADADARMPKDPSLGNGVTCDAIGCVGKLGDGRLVSMILAVEGFAEDCARAAVVLSTREAPSSNCAAKLIDRNFWRTHGAVALRWTGNHFEQTFTYKPDYKRPWMRNAAATVAGEQAPPRLRSPDATPRPEDLNADD
jgi:competence protein ComEC